MLELTLLPIELLSTSGYRRVGPLPYPTPLEIERAIENGITDSVVVRKVGGTAGRDRYEILKGVDIWLLAQKSGIAELPALVLNNVDEDRAKELAEAEGSDDPVTIGETIRDYCEERDCSIAAAAKAFRMSRANASNHCRLLSLDPSVRELVRSRRIPFRHALLLIPLSRSRQRQVAEQITSRKLSAQATTALVNGRKKAADSRPQHPEPIAEKDPATLRLERNLADLLGASVSIDYRGKGGGALTIGFPNLDCLDGILQHIGYRDF